jgi:dienelactone hydrolase
MKSIVFCFALLVLSINGNSAMISKEISYKSDTVTCRGFLAYDNSTKNKQPGILVAHEWWGLNDFAKTQAKRLAQMGYVAFAVDLYGNGIKTSDPKVAGAMAGSLRGTQILRDRITAGLSALLSQPAVDSSRTAAIGFCFGGSAVLGLAYSGANVKGVVSFHGGLFSPGEEDMKRIKARLLILHGANDPTMPIDTIVRFQDAMRKSGADWQMVYYGNSVHGFTNPVNGTDNARGVAYNAQAAQRSWMAMEIFLKEVFGPK